MNEDRVSSVQNKAKLLRGASCCSGTRSPVHPTAIYILLSRREKSKSGPRFGRNERNTRYMRAGNSPEHLYNLRDNPSRWRGAELTSPVFIREASPRVESLEFCSLVLRTRAQFRLMISHVFRPLSSKLRLKYNSPRILWYGILPLKTDNIDLRAERSFHGIDCQIFPDALITDWKICLWETFCFIYEGYLELCWIWFIAAYQPQPGIRCDVSSPLIRITSLNLKLIGSKHLPLEKSPLRVAGTDLMSILGTGAVINLPWLYSDLSHANLKSSVRVGGHEYIWIILKLPQDQILSETF